MRKLQFVYFFVTEAIMPRQSGWKMSPKVFCKKCMPYSEPDTFTDCSISEYNMHFYNPNSNSYDLYNCQTISIWQTFIASSARSWLSGVTPAQQFASTWIRTSGRNAFSSIALEITQMSVQSPTRVMVSMDSVL